MLNSRKFFERYIFLLSSNTAKAGIHFSIASTLVSVSVIVGTVVSLKLLSPFELGLWNSLSLILLTTPVLQLGVQSELSRKLPILLGKSKDNQALILVENSRFVALLVYVFFVVIALCASTVVFYNTQNQLLSLSVVSLGFVAGFKSLQIHYISVFRSSNHFRILSNLFYISSLISVASVYLVVAFGYLGFLLYQILINLALCLLLVLYSPFKSARISAKRLVIRYLARTGFRLLFIAQVKELSRSIPKILILSFGSIIQVGLFVPALAVFNVLNIVPAQIAQFFNPKMGFKFGLNSSKKYLWKYVRILNVILTLISAIFSTVVWVTTPWVLQTYFPAYVESEFAIRIMAIAFIFFSPLSTTGVLYTVNEFRASYVLSITELISFIVWSLVYFYVFNYQIIDSVSLGTLTTGVTLYFLNLILIRRALLN